MKTDVSGFVENKHHCGVYILHPFTISANKHFDTFLFITGAKKIMCIMFRDCHNRTGRGWAPNWENGECFFLV